MTEWLDVQSLYHQLAGFVLADLLEHNDQERHVLCYVGLSSKHKYNAKTLACKLREALHRYIRKSKEGAKYADLPHADTLVDSDAKHLFVEVLCTLLASNIQVVDSANDALLMSGRPAAHINPLRAVPYKVSLKTRNIIKPALFTSGFSSSSGSSDQDSWSEVSDNGKNQTSQVCSEDEELPCTSKKPKLSVKMKKKKKVKFENLDESVNRELLGTWSKQDISELDKRKQVLQNVSQFIDRFQQQVEKHVEHCQQCPVHCYSVLNKNIKKLPGRPPATKKH